MSLKDFENRISKIQNCPMMRAKAVMTLLGPKQKSALGPLAIALQSHLTLQCSVLNNQTILRPLKEFASRFSSKDYLINS